MTPSLQRIVKQATPTTAQEVLVQWAKAASVRRALAQKIQEQLGRLSGTTAEARVQSFLRGADDFSWFRNKGLLAFEAHLSMLLQQALEWKLREIVGSTVEFEIDRFELHPDDDGIRIRLKLLGNEIPDEVEVLEETFESEIAQKLREFGAKSPSIKVGRQAFIDSTLVIYEAFVLVPFDGKKLLLQVYPQAKLEELAQAVLDEEQA